MEYILHPNTFINGNNLKNGKIFITEDTKKVTRDEFIKHKRDLNNATILLSINGTIGNVAFYNNEKIVLGKSAAYVNLNYRVEKYLLYQIITSEFIKLYFENELTGSTIKNLGLGSIRKTPIPLPPTKAEQTAIATVLNDTDQLITQLEQLLTKKRNIKTGAMQELLKPKEGWEVKTLGEVATLKARIGWQGLTTAEYRKTGNYFLITGTEFKNGFIDWDSCFYVDEERYKQDRNIQVKEHDVLVTKDGTIGKIALIKSVPKPATLNSGVFVIRPVANSFHPEFFYCLLLSEVFSIFLSQLSAGSTINHLYQKDFVTFKFHQPKIIDEQKGIAQILSDMDNEIQELEKELEKNKMLKQGMMQSLLTGKIRLI
jgi:type I restriction enzyme S subunit